MTNRFEGYLTTFGGEIICRV